MSLHGHEQPWIMGKLLWIPPGAGGSHVGDSKL